MIKTVGIITDILLLVLNILVYMQIAVPKRDSLLTRVIMYSWGAVVTSLFFASTYFFNIPEAIASFVCVTLPSFAMFFALSRYKDCRFLITFCLLDTLTIIITFFLRAIQIVFGEIVGTSASVLAIAVIIFVLIKGKPIFNSYKELHANMKSGWGSMAISTVLIYILLIFTTSYPTPLVQRTEYLPSVALMSVTILAVYVTFVFSILQKKALVELNDRLTNVKNWQTLAYTDELTGISNRAAYAERIKQLTESYAENSIVHIVIIDIDNFKRINDTLGHKHGDITLQKAAEFIDNCFNEDIFTTYRIGGDEFAVIAVDTPAENVEEKISQLSHTEGDKYGFALSVGYGTASADYENPLDAAFEMADQKMYGEKSRKKSLIQ